MADKNSPALLPQTSSPEYSRRARFLTGALYGFVIWLVCEELGVLELLPSLRQERAWPSLLFLVVGVWAYHNRARGVLQWLTVLSVGLWLIVSLTPLMRWLSSVNFNSMPPRPVDAVIVLSSSMQEDGEFGTRMLARLLRGLELTQSGYAPVLVLTNVVGQDDKLSQAARKLTNNLKIPVSIITIGPVRDTHDEAVLMQQLAVQRGWKTILLVTSPSHSRRSLLTFRKAGLNAIIVPAQETTYDFQNPQELDDRHEAFKAALHEIVGLWIYQRRGWA